MKEHDEKIPNPKELEKEISEFLAKKFGDTQRAGKRNQRVFSQKVW
jgi:hypothetical protein